MELGSGMFDLAWHIEGMRLGMLEIDGNISVLSDSFEHVKDFLH
jgi:hypothetical protein